MHGTWKIARTSFRVGTPLCPLCTTNKRQWPIITGYARGLTPKANGCGKLQLSIANCEISNKQTKHDYLKHKHSKSHNTIYYLRK